MTDPARDPNTLRVLTFNLYGPANPDWDRRSRLAGKELRALNPDVVALQEVPVDARFLHDLLGGGYHVTPLSVRDEHGCGAVLATRHPHRALTELDQRITERSRETLPWCATLLVEMDTHVGTVVVAHHKPSWPFPFELERERQALRAARALEELLASHAAANPESPMHAVVLGDFDATPDAASMQFWRGRRSMDGLSVCYQDAWEYAHPDEPGFTFELGNPLVDEGEVATAVSRRIDHVLVRAGLHGPTLRVTQCERVLDRPVGGVWASDHYGVMADLERPRDPPGFRS
ncbi:endonuclease/exonuclease/phosphatase family protein [Actinopolymorpha singaporensis]|uniref:Metal-dependent hydrolase, endonuclease/exonuclease/phosphatase family n=1 Tax=Actinopolymorpha singaporensis TaxID=117157 RepID=A0A1H1XFL0_9ACTN|nr:endonuclease/exonuclease/phosphatase family protein [Actinopolymorpha singaporensis]SDT08065.1 Metal-dependent hydrolase, endonuclease/exonuclease/phosphatase family [Actinopolymorpha singaporensis]